MNEIISQHTFSYEILESDVPGVIPHKVEVSLGEVNLDEILEHFEKYLIAVGYVLPDGTCLGLAPKQ